MIVTYDGWRTPTPTGVGVCKRPQRTGVTRSVGAGTRARQVYNPMFTPINGVTDQRLLAADCITDWPDPSSEAIHLNWAVIYRSVKQTGLPNKIAARIPVKTLLNLDLWYESTTSHHDDVIVLNGITFGFSLQYLGGPLSENAIEMHASGERHIRQIKDYFDTEIGHGAIAGPFVSPPFYQWTRTSPIMTRPKAESSKRRVIIDLSYPEDHNVNCKVIKNNYHGRFIGHTLPKIDDVVRHIEGTGFNVALAMIDIKHAYRNFPGCPLDYPLNAIKFNNSYYLDLAMPFGARTSSAYMQKIANMISHALMQRGIPTHIYLDDVILYFLPDQDPPARMREAIQFMKALGLPLAEEKVQNPSYSVRYLGIWLDVKSRLMTMPDEKINRFLDLVNWVITQQSVSKRVIQSLIGKIIHLSSCVPAARTFIKRILSSLRAAHSHTEVAITPGALADLRWFKRFLRKYNGRSFMKATNPDFVIEADACLVGGGATDFSNYIAYVFPLKAQALHISILEALNCLAACRALLTSEKHSKTVLLNCDNVAAIESFSRGSARDTFLAAISWAMWYCLAKADINPIYQYTPGHLMSVPDTLSRMHTSQHHHDHARDIITRLNHYITRLNQYKPFHNHYLDFHDFL